ncbi:MAG TPA: queuosine precursor transporter [Candidatus Paceibacterota bacterium]|nr:queuosine precursor transporter [Candidatus Paceibacterota bacterium]
MMLRLGKAGIMVAIVVNLVLISAFGAKLIQIFGGVTNTGNVFYAVIFTAGAILTERYNKKEAYKSIWIGFAALAIFIIMGQLTIESIGRLETRAVEEAMRILYQPALRIAIASVSAFLVSQHVNIWLFDYLRQKSSNMLWFRIVASATAGQALDSIIFFTIAFLGAIASPVLLQVIFVGFIAKLLVAVISVPFIYRSRSIKVNEY